MGTSTMKYLPNSTYGPSVFSVVTSFINLPSHYSFSRIGDISGIDTVTRVLCIQDIHKRMVQFRKLAKNLFLTLHGHNVHRQQRQLSKFPMR